LSQPIRHRFPGSRLPQSSLPLSRLPESRSIGLGYLFWAASLLGICGLQRFYLRKPVSGALWLFTLGWCGIGQLVDLFLLPSMVEQANMPLRLAEALQSKQESEHPSLEKQLLLLARSRRLEGFTINDAILNLQTGNNQSSEAVRSEIERLLHAHLLDVGNDAQGRVVYREP